MKSRILKVPAVIGLVGLLVMTAGAGRPAAKNEAVTLAGTVFGAFDYQQGAWVGHVVLRFGDGRPQTATVVDRNTSFDMKANGAFYGTETWTVTMADGSGTFQILAAFSAVPQTAPGLYTLHEVGNVANGTGKYATLTGHVAVHGPFLFPDPEATPGAPLWISEVHGVVTGLE
jgi:hypothetical protein